MKKTIAIIITDKKPRKQSVAEWRLPSWFFLFADF